MKTKVNSARSTRKWTQKGDELLGLEVFLHPSAVKRSWPDRKIVSFVRYKNRGMRIKTLASRLKVSEVSCKNMSSELKRAAKKGYKDVREYLKAGRPCAAGKKVVA